MTSASWHSKIFLVTEIEIRGIGAAGSAFDWQSRGHGFEPRILHQDEACLLYTSFEDITYDWSKDVGDFYGKPLIRPNAMPKACGVCDYGDDIELHMPEETLKVELVQPRKYSHAKILNIDCSEAEKMPGVFQLSLIHI